MRRYRIELAEDQMRLIAYCLDDVSRFAAGQCELRYTIQQMTRGIPFDEHVVKRDKAEVLLKELKKVLLPELHEHGSKGYNGSEFIGNTYQIYRTILYRLAMDNDWDNVYSYPALPSGTMGTIKIEEIK